MFDIQFLSIEDTGDFSKKNLTICEIVGTIVILTYPKSSTMVATRLV